MGIHETEMKIGEIETEKQFIDSIEKILIEGAGYFGVSLNEAQITAFLKYKGLLTEWNEKINLTAILEDRDIIIKHFVDSLSIMPFLKETGIFADIGTGAGFPGIPIKIARPSLDVLLLDSLKKRIGFLELVIDELRLEGITAMHSRAEDAGIKPQYREKFDAVAARAVASLPVLLEYSMPLVKEGGIFIAMKGNMTEIEESGRAIDILGGAIEEIKEFSLPFSDMKRNIIIIKKLRQTPTKYPRKAGKASREPLV